ncbi:glycosyltransferase family 2 protein [Methylicorpusculum sp.]|uniref:glycosyltransferase family 2 protein n=2 Tax=Methylicorpusculum sp. TaxID=2713644 RepID=UPI0027263DC1|nr:glycosyltransferase [Methylicorpusculum sp.]MDO8845970.1 glycosyltransferase [Methylicorpusculum sp.]
MTDLTIIICTHNRSELLVSAIESINAAERPISCNLKILVIANACTDNTVKKLKDYQYHHHNTNTVPLLFEEELRPGKSYALNHAIRCVKTGFLCFMDDDQRIDKNYLISIIETIAEFPQTTMLCGPLYPDWQGNEPAWVHENGKYRIYPLPVPEFNLGINLIQVTKENQTPPGGQIIIRKDVFDRVGYFSEDLGPKGHNLVGGEDTDFFLRAINLGEQFLYAPTIIQYHFVDPNRFKLSYLLHTSYQRNRSLTSITRQSNRIPLYLYAKLTNYLLSAIFSLSYKKIRFYLIRTACILGQIAGHLQTPR